MSVSAPRFGVAQETRVERADGTAPAAASPAYATSGAAHWRASQLSLALIVLALLALLAIPPLTERRVSAIRERVLDVVESARDLTEDIERDVAIEADARRQYALTGDAVPLARFGAARADDERAMTRLRPLALRLGSGVPEARGALESLLGRWQRSVMAPRTGAAGAAIPDTLFTRAIAAAARLDDALGEAGSRARAESRAAQALEARLTIVLATLVLAAVLLLGGLAQRLRGLARMEQRLRLELEASVASRERLIRGFSHDLKNPLGAADGYAQLLEEDILDDPGRRRQAAHRLRASVASALRLLDDLLDLARAEAGLLTVNREYVDVGALARELAAEWAARAESAGVEIHLDLDPDLPLARTDPVRVRQILGNLVSNAIKYGAGAVWVRTHVERRRPPDRMTGPSIVISVTDHGPGIPPDRQAWIFDEFTRVDEDAAPGTGLGLAISLRIARALGGDLVLESRPGEGATFSLWVPA